MQGCPLQVCPPRAIHILPLFLALLGSGCSKAPVPGIVKAEYVLGTFCRIDLYENGNPELYNRLFNRLAELDQIFSANRDDSELARVNRSAGLEPVQVSPRLFAVLERALFFAEASGGVFDPTVGPLVKLWGIGTETPRQPAEGEIRAALDLVNWRDLELRAVNTAVDPAADSTTDPAAGTAFLKRRGMALDLGAIAKGYAADELTRILRDEEVPRALIDLGGNIYIWGKRGDGKFWRVGVQDPLSERGNSAGVLELPGDLSVVSSGVYERCFTGSDGRRYHHILELGENPGGPKGYPVENGLLSVTIIAASSMDADALSTSCFALGYEKGAALAAANGAEVIFIYEDKTIRGSSGAMAVFTLEDDSFRAGVDKFDQKSYFEHTD